MKQRYTLFLAAFAIVISAWAQPTIDLASYGPVPGNVFPIYSVGDQVAPASGSNITWDYSSISFPGSPTSTLQYVAPSGGDLPGTTVATVSGTNRSFFHLDANGYSYLGAIYGSIGYETCSQSRMLMPLPFTMGSVRSVPFQCATSFLSSSHTTVGSGQFTGVGYGTLDLPYGSVDNVLLVKLIQSSQINSPGEDPTQSATETFYFVKPGVRYPVLTIMTDSNLTTGAVSHFTFVLNGSFIGIHESLAQAIGIDLYPNPAQGSVEVVYGISANEGGSLEVLDLEGRSVLDRTLPIASAGIQREALDIAGLSPGLYQVRISDGRGANGVKKLVVQ